jgi:hypothetical protein
MKRFLTRVGLLAALAVGSAVSFAQEAPGAIPNFDGTELNGATAIIGGFLAIGILAVVGIALYRLGRKGATAAK